MSFSSVAERCAAIVGVDGALAHEARKRLDDLTKPQGSLGRLEDVAARLFCINRGRAPLAVDPAIMFTAAGDHGVAAENVSAFPQAVTRQMVLNFLNGGAAINALCRAAGIDLAVVDAGCAGGAFEPHPLLIDRRLGDGAANMAAGPAMSRETFAAALENGMDLAADAARKNYRCIGTGEMGIANTTPATAIFCALYGLDPCSVAGPGAGSSAEGVRRKARVVAGALDLHKDVIKARDYAGIAAALGGYEIASLTGIMLGAAECGLPFLVDGFICTAAFASARALCPRVADYAFLSHASAEPGYAAVLAKLDAGVPLLDLGLRLGEGTGAALALPILRASARMFNDMATFSSAKVDNSGSV